jgi:hypothetical protein
MKRFHQFANRELQIKKGSFNETSQRYEVAGHWNPVKNEPCKYLGGDEIKEHKCKSLPQEYVYITTSDPTQSVWTLIIQKEATEDDLEKNPYLENVGDIIWQTQLEITHCPYCGEQLFTESAPSENLGKFQHTDFSGWSANVY